MTEEYKKILEEGARKAPFTLKFFKWLKKTKPKDLDIVMGREKQFLSHSWLAKRTFRGIRDCVDTIRMAELPPIDFNNIQL